MAPNPDNPRIWIGAEVFVAPVGTTAPTDTTTALDPAWLSLGLLSEDGLTETRAAEVTKRFALSPTGPIHYRTTRSKFERAFSVTALEDNAVVFGLVNPGSDVETTAGITTRTVKVPANADPRAFLFQTVDGDVIRRRVVPRAEVAEVGDVVANAEEESAFPLTIDVYSATDGTLYLDVTDDPAAAVAP